MLEVVDTIEGGFDDAAGRLFFHPGLNLRPGGPSADAGHAEGMGGNRLRWQVKGAEISMAQTAFHPEFGIDEPNQCLEMRFSQPVCAVRLTWSQ